MHRDEQISYIVIAVAMILFLVWIVPTQIKAPDTATVSPRLIPQICAFSILGLAIYKFVSTLNMKRLSALITRNQYGVLGFGLAVITVSTVLMRWIGFWPGSVLIVAGSMLMTGARDWLRIVPYSVGLVAVTWLLLSFLGIFIR